MSAAPAFTFDTRTDVGRARDQNEDSCGEVEAADGRLLIVCDGMGGHEAGEVASRIAVDTIGQIFRNSEEEDPGERLRRGFLVANQRILTHADQHGLDRMGTTATAAFVRDGDAWLAHVGDSRIYHLRGGAVLWRTTDHTRVQKMVERGILTAEEAKTHEDANVVTRALGFAKGEEAPEPDVTTRPLRDGDTLLLCSDGLHDLVTDDELAELASYAPPEEATATLVELANRRGGHDNITVAIVRWGRSEVARPAGARRTALEFGDDVPAPQKTLDGSRRAPRKVDGGGAKEAATAVAGEDDRPRRALVFVIAGVALVGIAAAVYLMTRGGSTSGRPQPPVIDAGGGAPPAAVIDAGGAGPVTPVTATDAAMTAPGDAGSVVNPASWAVDARPAPPRPKDGGVPSDAGTPAGAVDAGAAKPAIDAGAAKPAVDAGAAKSAIDAGAAKPAVDAGAARPAIDAGAPKPAKPAIDAGAAKPARDGGGS